MDVAGEVAVVTGAAIGNLRGPMLATQLALTPMRRAGRGAVVNVASTAGLDSGPYQSPEYGAAKAGVIRFTSALAEVDGVRVNCVVPDWVATERLTAEERASTPRRGRRRARVYVNCGHRAGGFRCGRGSLSEPAERRVCAAHGTHPTLSLRSSNEPAHTRRESPRYCAVRG